MMMNVGMVSIACSELVANLSLAVKGMTLQIMITVMPDFAAVHYLIFQVFLHQVSHHQYQVQDHLPAHLMLPVLICHQ